MTRQTETTATPELLDRLVRYAAGRLEELRPQHFTNLGDALQWWSAHSSQELAPQYLAKPLATLDEIEAIVREILFDGGIRDSASLVREHAVKEYDAGANDDEGGLEWHELLRHLLLREKGFLYPNERAEYVPSETVLSRLIGRSLAWRQVMPKIRIAASGEVTAMVLGETGTGKTYVSRIIHDAGPRRNRPLVVLAAEMVGHEPLRDVARRALTDGSVEVGDQDPLELLFQFDGTLLIEEVGRLGKEQQGELLAGLETIEAHRTQKEKVSDFPRVLCTTSQPLDDAILRGQFRSDLFFRLAVFQIDLPPLRQRKEDIGLLARDLIEALSHKHKFHTLKIDPDALLKLERYAWPGNIRELSNILESAIIQSDDRIRSETISFKSSNVATQPVDDDPRISAALERMDALGIRVGRGMPEALVQFLLYARNRRFRTYELAEFLGVASSTARAYLASLTKSGFVRKFGAKKGTTYQVIANRLLGEGDSTEGGEA